MDLHLPILEYVRDRNDLLNLSRISKDWWAEANLILYRRVGSLKTRSEQQLFFCTINQNPGLASLVKEFSVEFHDSELLSPEEDQLVKTGFHAMERLENLSLSSFARRNEWITLALLGCSFRLRRFSWSSLRRLDEDLVLQFLAQQTQIQCLEICVAHPPPTLFHNVPLSTCPHLSTLLGGRATIEAFLPNRPITTLVWHSIFEESYGRLYDLRDSLSLLRVLCLGGKWLRPRLTSMSLYLSALEVLELNHIWVSSSDFFMMALTRI